jgi:alpha-tubulin suppressor-like RCC1 family protein
MGHRKIFGAVAAVAGTLALLASTTTAGAVAIESEVTTATVTPTQQLTGTTRPVPVHGDFDGDGRDDILWYVAGAGADTLWSGTARTSTTTVDANRFASQALPISGTYTPAVGDFDGDGRDDIFWYGRSSNPDSVWYFTGRGTYVSKSVTLAGDFQLFVGNFNTSAGSAAQDDVFLYGPGSASLWSGSASRTFTSRTYSPAPPRNAKVYVGNWRQTPTTPGATVHQDLLFYVPGTGADAIWAGNGTGTFTTSPVTINGTYDPIVGNFNASSGPEMHDIFWYAPGTAKDSVWMNTGAAFTSIPQTVNGTSYKPKVLPARGADGQDDILWNNPATTNGTDYLWKTTSTTNVFTYTSINTTQKLGDPGARTPLLADVDTAEAVEGGASMGMVSAGANHSCAVTSTGGVKCFGDNTNGPLGNGTSNSGSYIPGDVTGLTSGVKAVSAGYAHTCALTNAGGVKCWGSNGFGQLGDTTTTNRLTPVDVNGLTSGVASISSGDYHTCAVTTTGAAKCWGYNADRQLGDNTTANRSTPTDVNGLTSGVATISAGATFSCAVTTGGGAKCWGKNADGQVGDTTTTNRATPVDVDGLASGVATISTGEAHACALTTGGAVKCWGDNEFGQVGDNTDIDRKAPVNLTTLASGVASISLGYDHSCAVTTGGGAKCWGDNAIGAVGTGTTTSRFLLPTDVSGLTTGVATVEGGVSHTCAITTANVARCWGYNGTGQSGVDPFSFPFNRSSVTVTGGFTWGSVATPAIPANIDLLWWAPGNGAGQSEILWAELESVTP